MDDEGLLKNIVNKYLLKHWKFIGVTFAVLAVAIMIFAGMFPFYKWGY